MLNLDVWYLIWFLVSIIISLGLNKFLILLAQKYSLVDDPNIESAKKRHKTPIPLTGGLAIGFTSVFLISLFWVFNKYNFFYSINLLDFNLKPFEIEWLLLSTLFIMFLGLLDDKFNISIKSRFIFLQLAILATVIFGKVQIDKLSYPFEGLISDQSLLAILISYLWILICLSATKFLDGLDGIAGTVSLFGFLTIASIANMDHVFQPILVIFALIWGGSIIGFLGYNLPPAKVYLGEVGSTILGFWVGVLSILSGAKVATTTTVIGWFVLDITLVIIARILEKRPPLGGDRTHWHHRMAYFFPEKIKILAFTSALLICSSNLGLLLQTKDKLIMLIIQTVLFLASFVFSYKYMRYRENLELTRKNQELT